MKKAIQWKPFLIALAIPLAVGALASLLSRPGMPDFDRLYKPVGTPPDWVFPVVWTILYALMGYASYRVWASDADGETKRSALRVYGVQLAANLLWPLLFFAWELFFASLALLVVMLLLAGLCISRFNRAEAGAGKPLLPYLLWLAFALYLNAGILLLN